MVFELTTRVCLSRISSEDSGEVPSYNEDSDDSDLEFQSEATQTGQMNLLEEILDSLSTSHIEQGRMSAAKSLDFFRSIEDLDYSSTVREDLYLFIYFLFLLFQLFIFFFYLILLITGIYLI